MVVIFSPVSSPCLNTPAATAVAAVEVASFTSGAFPSRNCSSLSATCSRSLLCVSKCFRGMAESVDDGKRDFTTAASAENGPGCPVSQLPVSLNFVDFRTEEDVERIMLLRRGSQIIWIAPSGGRDRPDPVTQECYFAQFDASSVDNMRRLVEQAGVSGNMYPLALLCYDIMPPPPQVEKDVGEKKIISFHGVGLSVGQKINFLEVGSSFEDPEEAKVAWPCTSLSAINTAC